TPETRTSGVMPAIFAARHSWVTVASEESLCSVSMNRQSKPAVLAIATISTPRTSRTIIPTASFPESILFRKGFTSRIGLLDILGDTFLKTIEQRTHNAAA